MLNSAEAGRYLSRNSEIHKLNSIFKLLSLVILLISIFFINSYEDVIMLSSYLALAIVNSGISIKIYLKELFYYKIFFLIVLIIDILALNTIEVIVCDLFRLMFIILYISLFVHVTTIDEIMYSVEKISDPLHMKKDSDIIIYISLIFKFPHVFNEELKKIIRVYKERRLIIKCSFLEKIKEYIDILTRAFDASIRVLNNMLIAMKIRLYGYGKSRTNYRLKRFDLKEGLLILLEIVILIVVIFY